MKPVPGLFPLPDRVAAYGGLCEFERSRKQSGQWVFWEDRVELVLQGRYDEVRPLHVELSPTYLCNFACPWCSCRSARQDWNGTDVFSHPEANERTVMGSATLLPIVERLAAHGTGIQWVGGEPMMNPLLIPAARRARELGIKQCLFTNGSVMGPKRIRQLLEAELEFVRVSLDAATPEIHEKFHGYAPNRGHALRVRHNLRELVGERLAQGARTEVGVSIVVDARNIDDLVRTIDFLVALCDEFGAGAIDFVVIRPAYTFEASEVELSREDVTRLRALIDPDGEIVDRLRLSGIRPVVPEDSFRPEGEPPEETQEERCLACGWFGEIVPNGDLVICSDRYGDPDYFIGNLRDQSVDEIWGRGRPRVLERVEQRRCFRTACPRNGRGYYLNRVFRQVEAFREKDRLSEVRHWIEDLRRVLPRPAHSFFL